MPGPFTITPSSTLITLEDDKRQGTVVFTVKNDTSRRIRATARLVVPEGSPAASWLTILQPGDPNNPPELPGAVRLFDLGETETYLIKIAAPSDAIPATHLFRLVVADESNPDDSFSESTDVSVVLNKKPDPPPPPPPLPPWVIPVAIIAAIVLVIIIVLLLTRDTTPPVTATATPTVTATATQTPIVLTPNFPHFGTSSIGNDLFLGSDPVGITSFGFASLAEFEAVGVDSFGNTCNGWISSSPIFGIEVFDTPSSDLTFFFQSTNGDTTLLILDPSGSVHCNDNAQGFQPGIAMSPVEVGTYFIWIGTIDPGRAISGNLLLTSDCRNFFDCS